MASLTDRLLNEIKTGRLEQANRTVQLLSTRFHDPAFCTQETLAALEKARILALIQRSHIQRRLRSVAASRLYGAPVEPERTTWQIHG